MKFSTFVDILAVELKKPFDAVTKVIITELIISSREQLIRQQYERDKSLPINAIVSTCFPLELKPSMDCCELDLGCQFLRTVDKIPLPIDIKDNTLFNYVGGMTGMVGFTYLKPDEIGKVRYRKFSRNNIFYTWINQRIVLVNTVSLEEIKVRYAPANPLELAEISNCSGKPCYDLENELFIEGHWEDAITKMILPKLMNVPEEQIVVDK